GDRRLDLSCLGEQIAARRLGKTRERQTPLGKQCLRHVEQATRLPFDELDLGFSPRNRTAISAYLAIIDRKLGACTIAERALAGSSRDHGLAHHLQRRPIHLAHDLFANRLIRNGPELWSPAGGRSFQLFDLRKAAVQGGPGLDGLYPSPTVPLQS